MTVSNVRFGSRAKKSSFEAGWDVVTLKVRADRYSEYWFYLPALLLAGFVWRIQRRRSVGAASTLRQTVVESA